MIDANDRKRLGQVCRNITRPALSDERVQLNVAGQLELKLTTPWGDGTTHLAMTPLEFMQWVAALGGIAKIAPTNASFATQSGKSDARFGSVR